MSGRVGGPTLQQRKVWVRRPGATPTLVPAAEDFVVDELKDFVLRKYANQLGRHYDSPDITIRIQPRDHSPEYALSADELLFPAIENAFPGGQTMEEALIIILPAKRTPRQSPGGYLLHHHHHHQSHDDGRAQEAVTDYFGPITATSPGSAHGEARAISVLTTGQLPPLMSPGGSRRLHQPRQSRPNFARQITSSPTTHTAPTRGRARRDSQSSEKHPSKPAPHARTPSTEASRGANPPIIRQSSPIPSKSKKLKSDNPFPEVGVKYPGRSLMIADIGVPPINVLIVEDNMINMKLLEQFVRRLKVNWAIAINGKEAVEKWRKGGFHLVLMDIQLPIMSGVEATKEIRRLEKINQIGVLSKPNEWNANTYEQPVVAEEDKLKDISQLFKSPVIIVALTASNLQSDRHEALAAGCNDFLTKPVNFAWFERKVKEWSCMQALIDYDGWRQWRDVAVSNGLKTASDPKKESASGGLRTISILRAVDDRAKENGIEGK